MSVPSWARKGAKVICIKTGAWERITGGKKSRVPLPKFGDIFTIDAVIHDSLGIWLLLVGYTERDVFDVRHFRPLVDEDDQTEAQFYSRIRKRKTQRIPHHGTVKS